MLVAEDHNLPVNCWCFLSVFLLQMAETSGPVVWYELHVFLFFSSYIDLWLFTCGVVCKLHYCRAKLTCILGAKMSVDFKFLCSATQKKLHGLYESVYLKVWQPGEVSVSHPVMMHVFSFFSFCAFSSVLLKSSRRVNMLLFIGMLDNLISIL